MKNSAIKQENIVRIRDFLVLRKIVRISKKDVEKVIIEYQIFRFPII